jgi:hypothetical protein
MGRSPRKNADVVRRYLETLGPAKPKGGRRRTPESIAKRLEAIEATLADAGALQKLALVQERIDLQAQLQELTASTDAAPLEAEFTEVARAYGEAKGISYAAWREMGVTAEVLKAAGVRQTRRRA